MRTYRIIAMTIGGLLVAGCAGGAADDRPEERSPAPATETPAASAAGPLLRGHAIFGDGVHALQRCGAHEALWISAGSELLGEAEAEFEMFVVVETTPQPVPAEGPGAGYPGAVEIEEVLYAGLEGPGCDFEWDSFYYRARGNEPFWMLEVNGPPGAPPRVRSLRLVRPGEHDALLDGFVEDTGPDGKSIRIGRPGGEGDEARPTPELIELVMRREPCRDSMSGAYFGLSAHFRYLGRTFTGCVLVGSPPTEAGF